MLQTSIHTPLRITGVMDELHERLEQAALEGPNGGAFIGIAWKDPSQILCVRSFGERANWVRPFDELTELKIGLARRLGVSTRSVLSHAPRQLLPEERGLHPGALIFNGGRLIVASSGFGIENEPFSMMIGERLESFDLFEQQPRLVATG